MKKLFIAAMALATMVSCSKDHVQEPVLDSVNKSIAITIENSTKETRGNAGHTTEATDGTQIAVTKADDLMIFFADANDKILEYKKLVGTEDDHEDPGTSNPLYAYGDASTSVGTNGGVTGGDYIFHNVPAAVTKIAIARYESDDLKNTPITKGTTELDVVSNLATSTINEAREIDDICLYGVGTLGPKSDEKCVEYNGVKYYVYPVSVEVKPAIARLEIHSIGCEDLGVANDDLNEDGTPNIATFGIDELALKSLGWGGTSGESYVYNIAAADFKDVVLHGTYKAGSTTVANNNDDVKGDNIHVCPTASKVWSWNVPAGTKAPSSEKKMTLGLTAKAYDYQLPQTILTLNVTGLTDNNTPVTEFAAGHIYKLDLLFDEGDIDGQEGICVDVEVKIVNWIVKTVDPVFGN